MSASAGVSGPLGSASATGSLSWANWIAPPNTPVPADACIKESNREICFDAVDNNCNGQIDEGCAYNTGLLQFVIAWKTGVDLNLHVIGPDGVEVSSAAHGSAGLVLDRACRGIVQGRDDCPDGKVENIYLPAGRAVARGHYRVAVDVANTNGLPDPAVPFIFGARVGAHTFAVPFILVNRAGERREFGYDVL